MSVVNKMVDSEDIVGNATESGNTKVPKYVKDPVKTREIYVAMKDHAVNIISNMVSFVLWNL